MTWHTHNRVFIIGFILSSIQFSLSAQRIISGRITDAENGDPIINATVFIANTTIGTTTDASGYYQLKMLGEGSFQLTVSHVAYEPVFIEIESGKMSKRLDIPLQIREMEDVEITVKIKPRNSDVKLFWKKILGRNPSKKSIYTENPESAFFYYNSQTEKLTVSCRDPLQIVNNETGYHIQYVLNYFTHDFKTGLSSWEGQCFFTKLETNDDKQRKTWENNRKKLSKATLPSFIKSLYHNSTYENGILLILLQKKNTTIESNTMETSGFEKSYRTIGNETIIPFKNTNNTDNSSHLPNLIDSDSFISSDSITGNKVFQIPSDWEIMLVNFDKPITKKELEDVKSQKPWHLIGSYRHIISTPKGAVIIFPDGSYQNPISFSPIFGSYSLTGLNKLLPADYYLEDESGVISQFVKNAPEEEEVIVLDPLANAFNSVVQQFDRQLALFPQEKIHLHIDKPYYIAGERIWFRAHVVDAATHVPSFSSNSVFVELFDACDSVVFRVRTSAANDLYSGFITIPDDAPEGDYIIRAYTGRMRNFDEDCFFLKSIHIGDPMTRIIQTNPAFEFLSDQKIGAAIRFSRISPTSSAPPISPESVKISINGDKSMNLKSDNGLSVFSFNLSPVQKQRVMLLNLWFEKNPFRQYIKIPLPDDDFDVSFYPEGGSALNGCRGRIAVKAMQGDGTEIDLNGIVFDGQGNELIRFETNTRGMGQFTITPKKYETYYAICTNGKGQSKRFELPTAKENGYALSALWFRDRLMVNVLQPESQKKDDTLCLMVHTRGVVKDVRILENTNEPVVYEKKMFASGINQLLLLTKEMIPVSERLVFVFNDDQATVECSTDRDTYSAKSPVEYTVSITDSDDEPVYGNFSVSVTDDHVLTADTTSNILTSLLLSSDLRGALPNPAYFFRKNNRSAAYSLDLLMLTQGWRRYDTEKIVRNVLIQPDTLTEKGYDITGTVRTVRTQRLVENAPVSLLSMDGKFSTETLTDRYGRFYLSDGGSIENIPFVVQTTPQSGTQNVEITLDKESYPERIIPVVASGLPEREVFARYADKAEKQYAEEEGIRIIHLEEVIVTAQAPKKNIVDYSYFYKAKDADYTITEEDIEKFRPASMNFLLRRIPNLFVEYVNPEDGKYSSITDLSLKIKRGKNEVIVTVNDMPPEMSVSILRDLSPSDIAQIDLVYGPGYFFSNNSTPWLLSVTTKVKKGVPNETPYIKHFINPLGFQKSAEFYSPKYDASAQNTKPDLRTTIHWQPNITTDKNGRATFRFYTADTQAAYSVVIEGVTKNGEIVYHRDNIMVGIP